MIKFEEVKNMQCMKRLKIHRSRIRLLWHSGYWDGPLSGMALLDGTTKVWFSTKEEGGWRPEKYLSREYWAVKLDPVQSAIAEERHAKFERMVGTHTNYDENGKRTGVFFGRTEECAKYYEENKDYWNPNLDDCEFLGWFVR